MIGSGSSCVITHDIIIGGLVAFGAGEHVTVEQIAPHAQMPENKYVVLSTTMQQRFQLKATNLQEVNVEPPVFKQSSPPTVKKEVPTKPAGAKEEAASSDDKQGVLVGCLSIVAVLALIIVIVAVIVSSLGKNENKVETPTAEAPAAPAPLLYKRLGRQL